MAKAVMEYTTVEKKNKQILKNLRELGEGREGEANLKFGDGFMLPDAYQNNAHAGVSKLLSIVEAEEEEMSFSHTLPYKPWDGAVAVKHVFEQLYGTGGVATKGFFGVNAEILTIPVGPDEHLAVMWGELDLPMMEGTLRLGSTSDSDGELQFRMTVTAAKKNEGVIKGFWKAVEAELKANSIYRGKAIDGSEMPLFLDLSKVDQNLLVFNKVTELQLKANIYAAIDYRPALKKEGVDTKRTVMLEGPYGTGKSEVGLITATKCVAKQRTFLLCNPKDNNVFEVLKTAAMYQPATVFIEDIDVLSSTSSPRGVQKLLDVFDGLLSKDKDIMVIFTTNHKGRIHKGMLRPGRLDAIIHLGELDAERKEQLIRQKFEQPLDGIDFPQVVEKLEGFMPAFIGETCKKVKLFAIARAEGKPHGEYETIDFLAAAQDMQDHHQLYTTAGEGTPIPALEQGFREIVLGAMESVTIEDENECSSTIARS